MFKLEIELGNESMQTADDVSRTLTKVAARLKGRDWAQWEEKIRDDNGNTVGSFILDGAKTSEDCPEDDEED